MLNKGKDYWDASISMSTAANQYQSASAITAPYDGNPIELTLFVSCYNEEAFIENTLNTVVEAMKIVGKTYEIIVIDDCSKDHSVELVETFIAVHPDLNIILRANKKNKGWAQNYIDGAFIGRGKYYRTICGDNSEPVETMVDVLNQLGKADIIVPYYLSAEGKSSWRQFLSKLYTNIINLISGNKIHYYNGLHVHLRHNVMRWHSNTRGFGFQAGMLCMLLDMGFSFIQIPCITIERRGGRGNAVTLKNLRSVTHTMTSILLRRLSP